MIFFSFLPIEGRALVNCICAVFLVGTARKFTASIPGFGVVFFRQFLGVGVCEGSHSKLSRFLLDNCYIFPIPQTLLPLEVNLISNLKSINIMNKEM